jgi:uncharacterized membrane protein
VNTVTANVLTTDHSTTRRPLWRPGVVAGLVAAAATCTVVAIARRAGVDVDVQGKIPLIAFAQFSVAGALLGIGLAKLTTWRATNPTRTFTRITVALTALSLVPDVVVDATIGTKLILALTHLVAASIIIPTLRTRLAD